MKEYTFHWIHDVPEYVLEADKVLQSHGFKTFNGWIELDFIKGEDIAYRLKRNKSRLTVPALINEDVHTFTLLNPNIECVEYMDEYTYMHAKQLVDVFDHTDSLTNYTPSTDYHNIYVKLKTLDEQAKGTFFRIDRDETDEWGEPVISATDFAGLMEMVGQYKRGEIDWFKVYDATASMGIGEHVNPYERTDYDCPSHGGQLTIESFYQYLPK